MRAIGMEATISKKGKRGALLRMYIQQGNQSKQDCASMRMDTEWGILRKGGVCVCVCVWCVTYLLFFFLPSHKGPDLDEQKDRAGDQFTDTSRNFHGCCCYSFFPPLLCTRKVLECQGT